jgi:hypothetical protein
MTVLKTVDYSGRSWLTLKVFMQLSSIDFEELQHSKSANFGLKLIHLEIATVPKLNWYLNKVLPSCVFFSL